KHQSSARNEFQVEIAEQKAAQMGRVCGISGIAEGAYKCDEGQDAHHVLQANRDREGKHEDFLVAEEHRCGHEDGIDTPGGADRRSQRADVDDRTNRVSQDHGAQPSPDNAEQVELPELPAAPGNLQHGAEHPQHEHVEEHVKEATVKKTVGQQLVNVAMDDI